MSHVSSQHSFRGIQQKLLFREIHSKRRWHYSLGQVMLQSGIRIHQSLNSYAKANVQWVSVKFKGIDEYSMTDLSRLCDQWATDVAKLITAYNCEVDKKIKARVDNQ